MPRSKNHATRRKPYLTRLRERKLELQLAKLRPVPEKEPPLIQPITEYNYGDYPVLKKIRKRKRHIQVEFTELLEIDRLHHQEKALAAHRAWLTEQLAAAYGDDDASNLPSYQSSAL